MWWRLEYERQLGSPILNSSFIPAVETSDCSRLFPGSQFYFLMIPYRSVQIETKCHRISGQGTPYVRGLDIEAQAAIDCSVEVASFVPILTCSFHEL
jgi:hypothetical protein